MAETERSETSGLAALVSGIAYAIARAPVPAPTDTARDVAARFAPLVVESGYLATPPDTDPSGLRDARYGEVAPGMGNVADLIHRLYPLHDDGLHHVDCHDLAAAIHESRAGGGLDEAKLARVLEAEWDKPEPDWPSKAQAIAAAYVKDTGS